MDLSVLEWRQQRDGVLGDETGNTRGLFSRRNHTRYIFTTIEYKTFFLVQIIIIMPLKSDSVVKKLRSV